MQLLSRPGESEGIPDFADEIAGECGRHNVSECGISAKVRGVPPGIASFTGAKCGDGANPL
ncbi:uncharacterized protein N7500_009382 [Penicillium coprophilum]|uniref:uncharacterized protein n=1 Tax=Penicillium coprophilum TaxID=36646 RepID=UPI0023853993|nr:uncharacterized protein N7500_009382 [Penicillium coprophilum]KAJ5153943.1 hypothetical protein N7500_009382 [Penicillium coprophilum]